MWTLQHALYDERSSLTAMRRGKITDLSHLGCSVLVEDKDDSHAVETNFLQIIAEVLELLEFTGNRDHHIHDH